MPQPAAALEAPGGRVHRRALPEAVGGNSLDLRQHVAELGSRKPSSPQRERARAEARQCVMAGGGSALLPHESRRRSAEVARARRGRPGGAAAGERGVTGDRGGARHRSADLADPGDSASALPDAPRVLAARRSGAHVRRRDPVLIAHHCRHLIACRRPAPCSSSRAAAGASGCSSEIHAGSTATRI